MANESQARLPHTNSNRIHLGNDFENELGFSVPILLQDAAIVQEIRITS